MSDTDSFLQEVSEELRRDRLYRNIRKYGWIAILLVIVIVGAATYREYLKSQAETEAELFGTSIIDALNDAIEVSSIDPHYRDLLNFKTLLKSSEIMNLDERLKAFSALSKPGNPFRLLAEEQMALIELELGNTAIAIEKISQILLDAELTVGLRNRATQMMIALGKDPEVINK